jgi:hypothetical protein
MNKGNNMTTANINPAEWIPTTKRVNGNAKPGDIIIYSDAANPGALCEVLTEANEWGDHRLYVYENKNGGKSHIEMMSSLTPAGWVFAKKEVA